MDPGKVDRAFFEEFIGPRLGADRADVRLGPTHGADFGVIDVGERCVALATDPLFVLRDLGLERAAWFAFHIVVSDVALSGIPPTHLSVDFNLPPDTDEETFGEIWSVFDREARILGIDIVTGHTGAYAGTAFPTVGGATAIAVGDPADLVVPTGASPGDRLVVTKGPAIETTGVLATVFGDAIDLPDGVVAAARERFDETSPVRDALTAAAAGPVTAMHDATEGGVENALVELASASGVGLRVERERIPVGPGVAALCEYFDVDPWIASSEGTVLLTVEPDGVEDVLGALDREGIRAEEVGEVTEGADVIVDGDRVDAPEQDPFWPAYERARERVGVQ
ncbi:AIR synthase family protein [Halanaeroarchaeum sulfurireducens]|uniref:AIR synthase related protein domain protein n=1 Tax=Halanaeroarchaeum sulfurireducens TaxID=1604004 RepID=A0A0F7PBD1_9EURY|nr:AIR synthase family protein [Halanaeroarchaeum sulfurireducens]AKH96954.1 AIR synthase related protein domain protein [Halanaeroarchaeum sulfurireducens]ALG81355.1 AIR synthase related protein domain protein [Halanaeroarchaeum sulfurireducens]